VQQSSASLRGRALILEASCMQCVDRRDALSAMRNLQRRTRNLGDAVRLVSLITDARPAQLQALRTVAGAGPRWQLLAGAASALAPADTLVLIDERFRVRGRYRPESADDVDRLVSDVALLAALR
jgi:hypothetical protein